MSQARQQQESSNRVERITALAEKYFAALGDRELKDVATETTEVFSALSHIVQALLPSDGVYVLIVGAADHRARVMTNLPTMRDLTDILQDMALEAARTANEFN